MLLLVLLLLPSLSLSTLPTPASRTSSSEGIKDPTKCIDIPCYKPIKWSHNTEEVCRFKKEKQCTEKIKDVSDNILMTDFETLPHVYGADLRGCDGN